MWPSFKLAKDYSEQDSQRLGQNCDLNYVHLVKMECSNDSISWPHFWPQLTQILYFSKDLLRPIWTPNFIKIRSKRSPEGKIDFRFVYLLAHLSYCDRTLSGIRRALNDISSETVWPILIKLHIDNPLMVHYQNCSNEIVPCRILVAMAVFFSEIDCRLA